MTDPIYNMPLNQRNTIKMYWSPNFQFENVTFEIHLYEPGAWLALGFSDRGDFYPADYCVFWRDSNDQLQLTDTWTDNSGRLHVDQQQDCLGAKYDLKGGYTRLQFHRRFDTCDKNDYIIEEGTTHIVWIRGTDSIEKIAEINIRKYLKFSGMIRVQLLKEQQENIILPYHVQRYDIRGHNVRVPSDETTYWCKIHKLPPQFRKKHHIYRYEPVITPQSVGLVHHMEVFHCEVPPHVNIPLYEGDCFSTERPTSTHNCKRVLAAWAMGATAFTYPMMASLPMGGHDFNLFLMLEVHYNNVDGVRDHKDSSGIRFYVSDVLKKMDAGVMETGLEYTDKMAIPPMTNRFILKGHCTSQCTSVSLPLTGIEIFGSQLHTHLLGIAVKTIQIRNGMEIATLNVDNHFSTHFQEIRKLKQRIQLLPGDALITSCTYDAEKRSNVTLGGFAITDEMCVNYIHYYPATNLEVCKSSISDQALQTYFRFMHDWRDGNTSPNAGIANNYQAIEWTQQAANELTEVYDSSPISMQCNMSTGERFPGFWENIPATQVLYPMPPPYRSCSVK